MRVFAPLLLVLSAVGVNGEGNACLDSCTSDPSDPTVTELVLRTCLIDDFFINDLKDCFDTKGRSSLTSVNLWGNSLTELPADIFTGMTSLTYLNIELNDFTTLPSGLFDELTSLETLWISNNKFVSLPAGLFDKLTSLTFLDMIITDLTSLPSGMFDKLSALEYLGLSDNEVGSLEPGMFDSMPNLEQLFLTDMGLTSVPAGIFDETPLLRNLALSVNDLTTLPAGLFEKLTLLDILSLHYAPDLQCVPYFSSFETAGIQLDDDDILVSGECGCTPAEAVTCPDGSTCAPGAFGYTCETSSGGDYSLVGCYADSKTNRIMTGKQSQEPMSAEICFGICNDGTNTHFGTQYYTECWCSVDPDLTTNGDELLIGECDTPCSGTDGENCGGSDKITAYVIGGDNEGNACLDACSSDPTATELDLSNCLINDDFINELNDCFDTTGRSSLTSVTLWGNSLTELPADIFAGMTALTYLNIELNDFTTLPSGLFDELSSLETLWISNNEFASLPAGLFDKLTSLTFLDMIITELTSLPSGMFDNLSALEYLGLSYNKLGSLELGMFDSMTNLGQLFLSDTGLTSVPAGIFDNTPLLTNLALNQNDLTTLPAGLFEKLTLLDILSLNSAPDLQCVPAFSSSDTAFIQLDNDDILESGECGCTPAEAVTCPDGSSCAPGAFGYTCETSSGGDYSLVGCYADSKTNRIMTGKESQDPMSAEICFEICNDGTNTHFGTQYYTECWCSVDPDLTTNGDELLIGKCDTVCAGTTDGENCGGSDKITAYVIGDATGYQGCYRDALPRAMDAEDAYKPGSMTNELCMAYCADLGHAYAGTQYTSECFCGDSFDTYGSIEESECSFPCQADSAGSCGGEWALSVYATGASG